MITKAIAAAVILGLLPGICQPKTKPGTYITAKSCSISGVPLITHTKLFVAPFITLIFDIEPKAIIRPKGRAKSRVMEKSSIFSRKPFRSSLLITPKLIYTSSI